MSDKKFLTVAYDKTEKFQEIKPLLDQIHKFCQDNEIPYIFAASIVVDTENETHETCSSALLIGADRTPPELAIANQLIVKSIPEAMRLAASISLSGYVGGEPQDHEDDPDFTEGPAPTVSGVGHA